MSARLFAACLAALLVLAGCEANERPEAPPVVERAPNDRPPGSETIPFREDGRLTFLTGGEPLTEIAIEVADTDSAITRGLMQRDRLPEASGMLFVFPDVAPRSFWMANTPVGLDILFIGPDSQIVSIAKYTKPFSSESIRSGAPARWVLEVPAGYTDTWGIVASDRVRWTVDR